MTSPDKPIFGYTGRWAFVDLSARLVDIRPADPAMCRDYVGGRGVQARLLYDHVKAAGPIRDPLGPENRIILGIAALNDAPIPTAGRGSCSFIGTMTRSPEDPGAIPGHKPLFGLVTHASAGGLFPNMLKRAGIDQLVIDGRADKPLRLIVSEETVEIFEAEDDLFTESSRGKTLKPASAVTDFLTAKYPGSSTVCAGPAGWNGVAYACLTADRHRNFGRGGAGAVFGSKNLVAVTALGRGRTEPFDSSAFQKHSREIDALVKSHVADAAWTASFRPETGTTWWLDRAFNGGFLGKNGGYLPWRNFDEGSFDAEDYARVSTAAFLEIAGKAHVCNRCRHIMCTRTASVEKPPYEGIGVRPEFETIALWINCCITDRDAIFRLNHLCNELGIDTMTFGSVVAGAMELNEKGYLRGFVDAPVFGSAEDMIRTLESVAYRTSRLGRLLGRYSDAVAAEIAADFPSSDRPEILRCITTVFGGLGYAGIEPKVFPGMFTAYGTSNRGRGDHTYAWTIQAEESGLSGEAELAAYVAAGQTGKALVDSLGLCDFFTEDVTSDLFLAAYQALTGISYTGESLRNCGRRIYTLERRLNNIQGRDRIYDAFVPAKMTEPLTRGAHKGKAVDPAEYGRILDAYYDVQGWTRDGLVPDELLTRLGVR